MAYLIGEILVFLLAAALIGAAMAWMLRALRSQARERRLLAERDDALAGRAAAEASAQALEAALGELRTELQRQTGRLKARVAELEARQGTAQPWKPGGRRLAQAAAGCWRFLLGAVSELARLISAAARGLFQK